MVKILEVPSFIVNPQLLLREGAIGRVAGRGLVLDAAGLADASQGLRRLAAGGPSPDGYYCAGSAAPFVRFEPPTLRQIHLAGREVGPEIARQFEGKAVGNPATFAEVWEEHNRLIERHEASPQGWASYSEYLDDRDPLKFERDILDSLGVVTADRQRMAERHYRFRAALASEQTVVMDLGTGKLHTVRFTLRGDLPLRKGTILVPLNEVDDSLRRLDEAFKNGAPLNDRSTRERFVLLEAARQFQTAQGWERPHRSSYVAEKLFSRLTPAEREKLVQFHELYVAHHSSQEPEAAFQAFVSGGRVDLDKLPFLLRVFNFLGVKKPGEALYPLFKDPLDWAFTVRPKKGDLLFVTSDLPNIADLREGGLGWILTVARLQRGWRTEDFAEAVSKHLGQPIGAHRISDFAANRYPPTFPILRAIVAALNEDQTVPPVTPATALLAMEPTLLDLLPIFDTAHGHFAVRPSDGPFKRGRRPAQRLWPLKLGETGRLDPKGFPYLLRERLVLKGWGRQERVEKTGLSAEYLYKLIEDPEPGRRPLIPGRETFLEMIGTLGARPSVAVRAHRYSYWSEDEVILKLGRTFGEEVFIDPRYHERFKGFAASETPTPGELLYAWRFTVRDAATPTGPAGLPTEEQFGRLLGVGPARYWLLETNQALARSEEIDQFAARLGLTAQETARFREATERLAANALEGAAPVALPPELDAVPGLRRLVTLGWLRYDRKKPPTDLLVRKLQVLGEKNEESLRHLGELAAGETDPTSETGGRLLMAAHQANLNLRNWPPKDLPLEGPLAAIFTLPDEEKEPLVRRLKALRVSTQLERLRVAVNSRGCVTLHPVLKPIAYDAAADLLKNPAVRRLTQGADRRRLTSFFEFLRTRWGLGFTDDRRDTATRVASLAEDDEPSFRGFLNALAGLQRRGWRRSEARRVRLSATHVAHLVAKSRGIPRDGSAFDFFYKNFGDPGEQAKLSEALRRGNVVRIRFEGDAFAVEKARRATGRHLAAAVDSNELSTRTIGEARFVIRPADHWGRTELHLQLYEIRPRIVRFFDQLEERLGKNGAEVSRLIHLFDYNQVRRGFRTIAPSRLTDEALAPLQGDLSDAAWGREKEELRHLNTLHTLATGNGQKVERGPFELNGSRLRYFRYYNGISVAGLRDRFDARLGFQGYSDLELGKVELRDEGLLREIARAVGVPERDEDSFVRGFLNEQRRSRPASVLNGGLASVVASFMEKGPKVRRRLADASVMLDKLPISDRGGYHEAGMLIRLTRFLIPGGMSTFFSPEKGSPSGITTEELLRRLRVPGSNLVALRWEYGTCAMPPEVLGRYADLLVREKVLRRDARDRFVALIDGVYRRAG